MNLENYIKQAEAMELNARGAIEWYCAQTATATLVLENNLAYYKMRSKDSDDHIAMLESRMSEMAGRISKLEGNPQNE